MLPRIASVVSRGLARAPGCVRGGASARWTALGTECRGYASVGDWRVAATAGTGGVEKRARDRLRGITGMVR